MAKRFITATKHKKLDQIPRSKMSTRAKIFAGVIVEHTKKIFLVRDMRGSFPGYDIPGGKVLWEEEILECAKREFYEETGAEVVIQSLLGVYQRKAIEEQDDYVRFIFIGRLKNPKAKTLSSSDPNIAEGGFYALSDISKNKLKLKSPETLRELTEYIQGKRYPLDVVETYVW